MFSRTLCSLAYERMSRTRGQVSVLLCLVFYSLTSRKEHQRDIKGASKEVQRNTPLVFWAVLKPETLNLKPET
mgnify:CR=1 FL=1